jgi:hypothetical protein
MGVRSLGVRLVAVAMSDFDDLLFSVVGVAVALGFDAAWRSSEGLDGVFFIPGSGSSGSSGNSGRLWPGEDAVCQLSLDRMESSTGGVSRYKRRISRCKQTIHETKAMRAYLEQTGRSTRHTDSVEQWSKISRETCGRLGGVVCGGRWVVGRNIDWASINKVHGPYRPKMEATSRAPHAIRRTRGKPSSCARYRVGIFNDL